MVPATQSKWFQNAQVNTCEEHVICYTIYSKKRIPTANSKGLCQGRETPFLQETRVMLLRPIAITDSLYSWQTLCRDRSTNLKSEKTAENRKIRIEAKKQKKIIIFSMVNLHESIIAIQHYH